MDFPDITQFENVAEDIVLFGGAFMAILYGLKRMYTTARNVEKLVESAERSERIAEQSRTEIKNDLAQHVTLEDEKFNRMNGCLEKLADELRAHIKMEEDRDLIRDQQLIQLTDHMNEIIGEMRPNGGSSMKDILNKASAKVDEVHTRVAVLEQWKEDRTASQKKKITKLRRRRRTGRK